MIYRKNEKKKKSIGFADIEHFSLQILLDSFCQSDDSRQPLGVKIKGFLNFIGVHIADCILRESEKKAT
jgi:hypothetical protein